MGKAALAFAPGHISGYFTRVDGDTPKNIGSLGAGIVIDHGVIARVTESNETFVQITDSLPSGSPMISYGSELIEELLDEFSISAYVETFAGMPIGAGFGMSAAAILSVLTAANAVFDLGLTPESIAEKAHVTEVLHNTGLGDAAAASGGGVAVRNSPGVFGVSNRFYSDEILYAVTFGPIFTPEVLGSAERMDMVSAAFPKTHPTDIFSFMKLSREFAEKSGLITDDVRTVLNACDAKGVSAGMTMLGRGVFAVGKDAEGVLSQFGTVVPLRVSKTGPLLLECEDV